MILKCLHHTGSRLSRCILVRIAAMATHQHLVTDWMKVKIKIIAREFVWELLTRKKPSKRHSVIQSLQMGHMRVAPVDLVGLVSKTWGHWIVLIMGSVAWRFFQSIYFIGKIWSLWVMTSARHSTHGIRHRIAVSRFKSCLFGCHRTRCHRFAKFIPNPLATDSHDNQYIQVSKIDSIECLVSAFCQN